MKSPAMAQKLEALALIPLFEPAQEYGARLVTVRAMWAEFIRRNKIAGDQ